MKIQLVSLSGLWLWPSKIYLAFCIFLEILDAKEFQWHAKIIFTKHFWTKYPISFHCVHHLVFPTRGYQKIESTLSAV